MTQSADRLGQTGSARSVFDPVQLLDANMDDDVDADVDDDVMMASSLTRSLTRPGSLT